MEVKIADIIRKCRKSKGTGGLRYLFFFLPETVSAFGQRLCCPIVAAPVLNPAERFYLWRVEIDSPGLRENGKDTQQGVYYEQTVPFDIRRHKAEITQLAQMLRHKRIHCVLQDYQDEMLLMKFAKLSSSREISPQRTNYKGWRFNLSSKTRLPLPHIKKVPMHGVIDCLENYENVNLKYVNTADATVISDDMGNVLRDDEGNVLSSDF